MTEMQLTAIQNPCRFGFETAHPRFSRALPERRCSIVLSVNSGYE
jgi:hypothetical protein